MSGSPMNQSTTNVDQAANSEQTPSFDPFAEMLQSVQKEPPKLLPHLGFHKFMGEFQKVTPRTWVVWTIVALNIAVMVLMALADPMNLLAPSIETLVQWGADYGPRTLRHEWWRLLTCTFLHIGVVHLLFNMWALLQVGRVMERLVGNTGFGLLYLVSGIAGSLLSVTWNPIVTSAGASGAVFGVYGALLGLVLRQRKTFPKGVVRELRNSALSMLGYNVLYCLSQSGIDEAAHLGGALAGLLCGLMLSQPATTEMRSRRTCLNFKLGLTSAGLIGVSFIFLPSPPRRLWGRGQSLHPRGDTVHGGVQLCG